MALPYLNNCVRMMRRGIDKQYDQAASGLPSNQLRKLMSSVGEQELKLNQLLAEQARRKAAK